MATTGTINEIEIEYCVPCGYLPRAMDVQKSILERFGQRVGGVKLKTGAGGVFAIRANGQTIYTKPDKLDIETVLSDIDGRL